MREPLRPPLRGTLHLLIAILVNVQAARPSYRRGLDFLKESSQHEAWKDLWRSTKAKQGPGWCPKRKPLLLAASHTTGKDSAALGHQAHAAPVKKPACEGTLVGGFTGLAWSYSCCTDKGLTCAGCGVWIGGACQECAPGYTMQHGVCVACDDKSDWQDADGHTCSDYEQYKHCAGGNVTNATDSPFKGIRPSEACCACGGGETVATPFSYPQTTRVLLFGDNVSSRPSPRTARRYEVQPDCKLMRMGLYFHSDGSVNGSLPWYEKGDGILSEKCTVTALQDELHGLEYSAELKVTVQAMSYGSNLILFRFEGDNSTPSGRTSYDLKMAPAFKMLDLKAPINYSINCMPTAPWVKVHPANGTLYYDSKSHSRTAGLSGQIVGMEGTQCMVLARDSNNKDLDMTITVMKVFLWSGAYYPQTVFARKGRPVAAVQLWREAPEGLEAHVDKASGRLYWVKKSTSTEEDAPQLSVPPAMRPVVLGVKCEGPTKEHPVKWSKTTGTLTIAGQSALTVDPVTGDVTGMNEVDLPARLGLGSLQLRCAVALGGDAYAHALIARLDVLLEDDTCWYESVMREPVWAMMGTDDAEDGTAVSKPCSLRCLARKDCGLYWLDDTQKCWMQTSSTSGSAQTPKKVHIRSTCEEGVSCLEIKNSDASFLEGHYCPKVKQQGDRCFRPLNKEAAVDCPTKGYVMYTMRSRKRRFDSEYSGHFVCVEWDGSYWKTGGKKIELEATDVLVAKIAEGSGKVTSLQGTGGVSNGLRLGFASGNLTFMRKGSKMEVKGNGFLAWECGDISTAVFSRDGINQWDELFMARGPCPIPGRGGNWVVRRAHETDYMNPEDGVLELRGDVLACIEDDIEYEAFRSGTAVSTIWLPQTSFGSDYYAPREHLNRNDLLNITATLTTDSCQKPETETEFSWGTPNSAGLYTLDPCECFGAAHKDTEPVTDESRSAVVLDEDKPYNEFYPGHQLLLEGPYTCEDSTVLTNGQKNEVSEDECASECAASHELCRFFSYVPQLRYCILHQSCDRLGHTGIELNHRLFGVFEDDTTWCRIADPEACWIKKHRRKLLEGTIIEEDEPCAFQSVLEQCDALHLATGEAHGECRRCEFYQRGTEPSLGLKKRPLPTGFSGGAQLSVTCFEDNRLMSLAKRTLLRQSVLTCVGGAWIDENGKEGLDQLSCSPCVQVAQPSYRKFLDMSAPEVYLLGMRRLQYHFGVVSKGCRQASQATQAPLRSANGDLCMDGTLEFKRTCGTFWYLSQDSRLMTGGAEQFCLNGQEKPKLVHCSKLEGLELRDNQWEMDPAHRLRLVFSTNCLVQSGGGLKVRPCLDTPYPLKEETWYFDGGDCRYSMQLHAAGKPLTWRYELHGGAVLGSQTSKTPPSTTAVLDPMAFSTCKTTLTGALKKPDDKMHDPLELTFKQGFDPKSLRNLRAMTYTLEGRYLLTCAPGGASGAEKIAGMKQQIEKLEEGIAQLKKQCHRVERYGRPDCLQANEWQNYNFNLGNKVLTTFQGDQRTSSRRRMADRRWKGCFQALNAKEVSMGRLKPTAWSGLDYNRKKWERQQPGWKLSCETGYIVKSIETQMKPIPNAEMHRRRFKRRRKAVPHRSFRLQCVEIKGLNRNHRWVVHHGNWRNSGYGQKIDVQTSGNKYIVGVEASGFKENKNNGERLWKFWTVDLCGMKNTEIEQKKQQIKDLEAQIKEQAMAQTVCARELELPVRQLKSLDSAYPGNQPNWQMELQCHLIHRGRDGSPLQDEYVLTAGQVSEIARASTYHAVTAFDPLQAPFSSYVPTASAQLNGWFAQIDAGATIWGLRCKNGSVVAVHRDAASPHCVSVGAGASQNDEVMKTSVPGSGRCNLGFAVGGWYNLPGVPVKQKHEHGGGPPAFMGYQLFCREVPGLSRICETKEERCEADEVVSGIEYELGLTVKYHCCKLPKTVGHIFSDHWLHGVKEWEGYYCPVRIDETGRPAYKRNKLLGRNMSKVLKQLQPVYRATPLRHDADGLVRAWMDHRVYCKAGELLNQFKAERGGSEGLNQLRASFTCLKVPMRAKGGLKPEGCLRKHSKAFDVSVAGYAHAEVKCDDGHAMAGFQLQWGQDDSRTISITILAGDREAADAELNFTSEHGSFVSTNATERTLSSKTKGSFNYLCCAADLNKGSLYEGETSGTKVGKKFTDIAGEDVACKPGYLMTSFKLVNSGGLYKHKFTCVKPEGVEVQPHEPLAKDIKDQFTATADEAMDVMKNAMESVTDALWGKRRRAKGSGWARRRGALLSTNSSVEAKVSRAEAIAAARRQLAALNVSGTKLEEVVKRQLAALNASDAKLEEAFIFGRRRRSNHRRRTHSFYTPSHGHQLAWDKFTGVWKLWDGKLFDEPEAAMGSAAADPMEASASEAPSVRVEPKGYLGNEQPKFWVDGALVALEERANVVVMEVGARAVLESKSFELDAAGNSGFADFLNKLPVGRVVLLSLTRDALGKMTGKDYYALQRCGGSVQLGDPYLGSYSLVGIAGAEAVAESKPNGAVETSVPHVAVTPIVDFEASFVAAVEKSPAFPQSKPVKPKLLKFVPKQPDYDEFCDSTARTQKIEAMDCTSQMCPPDEHPCAHTYQMKITEQKFWDCQQRSMDRAYYKAISAAHQKFIDAKQARITFIYDAIEASLSLAASVFGAIPWGSYAVPAGEGAEAGGEAAGNAAKKIAETSGKKAAQSAFRQSARAVKDRIKASMKAATQRIKKALSPVLRPVNNVLEKGIRKFDKKLGLERSGNLALQVKDFIGKGVGIRKMVEAQSNKDYMTEVNEKLKMMPKPLTEVPDLREPDAYGEREAQNEKKLAEADWKGCNPIQVGLSKVMCDLYCVENSVKMGDQAILTNLEQSHKIMMVNFERLLEYHTQSILYGLGQLQMSMLAAKPKSFLFQPGSGQKSSPERKLQSDVTAALTQLGALPQLLHLDLSVEYRNGSIPEDLASWHSQAGRQLLRAVDRTLSKDLRPGGNITGAAAQAEKFVAAFKTRRKLKLSDEGGPKLREAHVAEMTQRKAASLRQQLRGAKEMLEVATPPAPSLDTPHEDPSVMAWYSQILSGFVNAHEQHNVFVQSRQRALWSAEQALTAAESYVNCGQQGLEELQGLWQRAYRLEDDAVRDLLGAWSATTAAQEKLGLAVQEGIVTAMAESVPLPTDAPFPCGSLLDVADRAHQAAVKSLDHVLWPLLEQVLALERLADLQEHELESKELGHVPRISVNATVLALYSAAWGGADPKSAPGKKLAARALTQLGPLACPAPAFCRRGGMLLLNLSQPLLWTSEKPGDLLLGKAPAEVAHACQNASASANLDALAGIQQSLTSAVGSGQGASGAGLQGALLAIMGQLKSIAETQHVEAEKLNRLDMDSHLCAAGCAEHLSLQLSRKRSAMAELLQRLR